VQKVSEFAGSELIQEGLVLQNLQRFYTVAGELGIVEQGACLTLMNSITLKSRAGASCLAIIAKSGKGVGAGLLEGFSQSAKLANDP
jgi:hypothetical protein